MTEAGIWERVGAEHMDDGADDEGEREGRRGREGGGGREGGREVDQLSLVLGGE